MPSTPRMPSDTRMPSRPHVPSDTRLPRVLAPYAQRRTAGELLYAVIGLPQGIFGFTFVVTTLSLGAGLAVTFVGLPLLAVSGLVVRWLGDGIRRGSNLLTGTSVAAPAPFRAPPGLLARIFAGLRDGTAWRARLYLVLKLPLGIASFVVATTVYSAALGGITYVIWRPFLPCQVADDGSCHTGASFGPHYYLDTPFRIGLMTLIGVLFLLAAPWAVRGVLTLDRLAVQSLLGPSSADARVEQLERTRTSAVDDSAATLRRIERDLHDGAQARMVAVAMTVGLAREKLAEGGDPAQASQLLDSAHASAKEAITELRDLARGIHPPVLDTGLAAALQTLVSHSPVPVELQSTIDDRPHPAIETMAYFCAAELLTNVAKHSRATRAWVHASTSAGWLHLLVGDDGRGGARVGAGTGLTGLAERVATVDGALNVISPLGGPTVVTVDLPLRSGTPSSGTPTSSGPPA